MESQRKRIKKSSQIPWDSGHFGQCPISVRFSVVILKWFWEFSGEMEPNTERELDNVPPSSNHNHNQPSPTSSPPTPPSPLPVSVGPGYQNYFFSSSPSISPPFSPNSSPQTSPRPPPSQNIPPPKQSIPSGSLKLRANPSEPRANPAEPPPATEYSPLLHANYFEAPAESVYSEFPYEDIEWPRPRRRRPTSFFRVCLERICCCCEIPDCCPPLFTD